MPYDRALPLRNQVPDSESFPSQQIWRSPPLRRALLKGSPSHRILCWPRPVRCLLNGGSPAANGGKLDALVRGGGHSVAKPANDLLAHARESRKDDATGQAVISEPAFGTLGGQRFESAESLECSLAQTGDSGG
jgi:hypothetical protein